MARSHLLCGEFGHLEGPQQSQDGWRKGIESHELTLMADVATGVWWDLLVVSLDAGHVLLAVALTASDHMLNLLLVRALMIAAVVVLTEAVDGRLASELRVVHETRRALALHNLVVSHLVDIKREVVRRRVRGHLRRRARSGRLGLDHSVPVLHGTVLRSVDVDHVAERSLLGWPLLLELN